MPDTITDSLSAHLDRVRERVSAREAYVSILHNPGAPAPGERTARSAADVPALLAAVEAVLELHRPVGAGSRPYCSTCMRAGGFTGITPKPWPCPTVRAISKELTGTGGSEG